MLQPSWVHNFKYNTKMYYKSNVKGYHMVFWFKQKLDFKKICGNKWLDYLGLLTISGIYFWLRVKAESLLDYTPYVLRLMYFQLATGWRESQVKVPEREFFGFINRSYQFFPKGLSKIHGQIRSLIKVMQLLYSKTSMLRPLFGLKESGQNSEVVSIKSWNTD